MLFMWLLSKKFARPSKSDVAAPIAGVVAASCASMALFASVLFGGVAAAQSEDDSLAGLPVTVENTFASDELTDGEEIVFGSEGPIKVGSAVEFAACCDDFYDIDVASDRITMTWVGGEEFARTIEAGTFDRYRFTVIGATFADAAADPDQPLVPEVTFFANSISVKISEGDEVGPGQDAVILIDPIVTAESRSAAMADAVDDAAEDDDAADDEAAADDELETLPRTGRTTEVVTGVGLFVLALGLISYGVGNRARRLELV